MERTVEVEVPPWNVGASVTSKKHLVDPDTGDTICGADPRPFSGDNINHVPITRDKHAALMLAEGCKSCKNIAKTRDEEAWDVIKERGLDYLHARGF